MLKIRLIRGGQKHNPIYKLVIMKSTTKRDGIFIKKVGFYNPKTKNFKLNVFYIVKNLNCGVQPTKRVLYLLLKSNIIKK